MNTESWVLDGLPANGPNSAYQGELMLFGQFVGDWEFVDHWFPLIDKDIEKGKGEIHFNWILEGRAVQDIWGHRDPKSNRLIPAGTTIRFYDSKLKAWRSTWLSPRQHEVRTFIGRLVGDRIVLDATDRSGPNAERWIFSHITTNSFRWHAEEKMVGNRKWVLTEEMFVRRKKAKPS